MDYISPKDFGNAVRNSRKKSGLRLVDAALALGISPTALCNLEQGKGGTRLSTALRVAAELGVEITLSRPADHFDSPCDVPRT